MGRHMILKPIIIVHRYVGVVLGVIMTLWCLSGFVMMYQPFPTPRRKSGRRASPRSISPAHRPTSPLPPTPRR